MSTEEIKTDPSKSTNWDQFYSTDSSMVKWAAKKVSKTMADNIKKYLDKKENISIAELGGGNSSFYTYLREILNFSEFHNIDNNDTGLNRFKKRTENDKGIFLYKDDALNLQTDIKVDVVFSYGLIEHFDEENTKKVIESHFQILNPGGLAIISYPTPTWLYKLSRGFAELFRFWIYHDERPLKLEEVKKTLDNHGEFLYEKILWYVMATQQLTVTKKY